MPPIPFLRVPTRPMPPTSTEPRLPERTATIRSAARGSIVTTYLPHLRKASSTSLRTRISMLLVLGGIGNVVLSGVPALSTTTETYLARDDGLRHLVGGESRNRKDWSKDAQNGKFTQFARHGHSSGE